MKRTAVEWLKYLYENQGEYVMDDQWKKALEMERWQIMNAYDVGWLDCKNSGGKYLNDQYYFEIFNSNEK